MLTLYGNFWYEIRQIHLTPLSIWSLCRNVKRTCSRNIHKDGTGGWWVFINYAYLLTPPTHQWGNLVRRGPISKLFRFSDMASTHCTLANVFGKGWWHGTSPTSTHHTYMYKGLYWSTFRETSRQNLPSKFALTRKFPTSQQYWFKLCQKYYQGPCSLTQQVIHEDPPKKSRLKWWVCC